MRGLAGAFALLATAGWAQSGWTEAPWPFLRDQFPNGRAFLCDAATCGAPVRLTVRAKIGFCRCDTGVSDDDELQRIGDVELVGPDAVAPNEGHEIRVRHMKGRARVYEAGEKRQKMLSLAFNDRCDVMVATATGDDPAGSEAAILAWLNGDAMYAYIEKTLGL